MKFIILIATFIIILLLYIKINPSIISYLTSLPPFNIISIAKHHYGNNNVNINYNKLFCYLLFIIIILFSSIYILIYYTKTNIITGGNIIKPITINDNFENFNTFKIKKKFII